ncbi:MAG: YggS family pyridoxal phosphate-dependent enzyme [Clostridia bacterium]|nr:YggS family pyridoxal phosphate-dependent enzyme [Clostridia bacterium]
MIEENVKSVLAQIPERNPFGEKITIVAAVKFQSVENINRAISAGIKDIGDNHVQEFREKFDGITGSPRRHFIGHLQTNKVKYLIGKVNLYHSVDRLNLAEELSKRSAGAGIISDILLQVNIGSELSKGGFGLEEVESAYKQIKQLPALKIRGLMAMLPLSDDEQLLKELAKKMRCEYDKLRAQDSNFEYLSMGMSGDWQICVEAGGNMIRLGTSLFGARQYK